MSEHAILAPSSAHMWGVCAGSVRAQQGRPDLETDEARAGTASHWVAAEVLKAYQGSGGKILCSDYVGLHAPNGVVIDTGMAEGAEVFVDDVLDIAQKHGALANLLVEYRVHMPAVHQQNWGTLDCAVFLPGIMTLIVWDYKHGHRPVEAGGNLQLVDYSLGLMNAFGFDGSVDQQITLVFRIVQPFCYDGQGQVRYWVGKLSDLRPFANTLRMKADEALSDNPSLVAGKHCRDCKARGVCPAVRDYVYDVIDSAQRPYAMDNMSARALVTEKQILERGQTVLKARLAAIDDEIIARIKTGEPCAYSLESSPGRKKFTVPPLQAIAIAAQMGVDIRVDDCLTPTQAIKKAPKDIKPVFEQLINAVSERKDGAAQLVLTDKTLAAKAFNPKRG